MIDILRGHYILDIRVLLYQSCHLNKTSHKMDIRGLHQVLCTQDWCNETVKKAICVYETPCSWKQNQGSQGQNLDLDGEQWCHLNVLDTSMLHTDIFHLIYIIHMSELTNYCQCWKMLKKKLYLVMFNKVLKLCQQHFVSSIVSPTSMIV